MDELCLVTNSRGKVLARPDGAWFAHCRHLGAYCVASLSMGRCSHTVLQESSPTTPITATICIKMSQVAKNLTTASLEEIVKCLDLTAHPEGGFYTESYRCDRQSDIGQSHCSAIYYLMTKDRGLSWHKLHGLDEMFHFYAGAPVEISLASPEGAFLETKICGLDIFGGQRPQVLVPANYWQSAKCLGEWTLYGCIVSPGFEIKYSEQAPDGWKPTGV